MKLSVFIKQMNKVQTALKGQDPDVWIGRNGDHGAVLGYDLRNIDGVQPDVFLRAQRRSDDKPVVP